VDEELFVVAETVERIEDGEVFCLVGVERWWENDAVRNAAGEDFAGKGVAFDAAGCCNRWEGEEAEEKNEIEKRAEGRGVRL
jgi:hypothetical protein